MKNIIYLTCLYFLFLVSSCDLYRPLPVESNTETPKLVVNAILDIQTPEQLTVNVSTSHPLNKGTNTIRLEDIYVNDAIVLFFENDKLIDTLQYTEDGFYDLSNNFIPKNGAYYQIKVEHINFENAHTEVILLPEIPSVSSIAREEVIDSNKDKIKFTVEDESNISNFYEMTVFTESEDSNGLEEAYISFGSYYIEDPACGLGQWIFPDFCFENKNLTQEIYVTNTDVTKMIFKLTSVSESYYKLFQSYQGTELDAFSQIFSEPNIYYSNVDNGYGVFYIRNTLLIEL